jgi:hypothetical protein
LLAFWLLSSTLRKCRMVDVAHFAEFRGSKITPHSMSHSRVRSNVLSFHLWCFSTDNWISCDVVKKPFRSTVLRDNRLINNTSH